MRWVYLAAWVGAALGGSFHINRDLYAKPAYSIRFSEESISDEAAAQLPAEDEENRYQFMTTRDRTRYLCSIPKADNSSNELTVASTDLVEAKSKAIELLAGSDGCIYYAGGFWTYELCFDSHIRQFHMTSSNEVQLSFVLARFEAEPFTESGQFSVQNNGEVNYLVQRVAGGELCDLTGRDRAAEVLYLCRPGIDHDQIAWIREAKTCFYQMAIYTPKLCQEPSFVPQQDTEANEILCRRVGVEALPASDLPDFMTKSSDLSSIEPPEDGTIIDPAHDDPTGSAESEVSIAAPAESTAQSASLADPVSFAESTESAKSESAELTQPTSSAGAATTAAQAEEQSNEQSLGTAGSTAGHSDL